MEIRIKELTKIFPGDAKKNIRDTIAVKDLDFTVPDGKLVGLLGPSGCGKSTTLYMISGLLKPSSGSIYFGEDDVTDLKLFCLTSPVSFSCGNLVPAFFKESDQVTLLGRTSGGGTCAVNFMSTADGTVFQISGHYKISLLKNGTDYDIDQGVVPHLYISDVNHFYDRTWLVNYLDNLL